MPTTCSYFTFTYTGWQIKYEVISKILKFSTNQNFQVCTKVLCYYSSTNAFHLVFWFKLAVKFTLEAQKIHKTWFFISIPTIMYYCRHMCMDPFVFTQQTIRALMCVVLINIYQVHHGTFILSFLLSLKGKKIPERYRKLIANMVCFLYDTSRSLRHMTMIINAPAV